MGSEKDIVAGLALTIRSLRECAKGRLPEGPGWYLVDAKRCEDAAAEIARLRAVVASDRCPDCNAELSACGETTADGPSMDCLVCRLRAEVMHLRAWVADLQSGMWVNCIYCGHRYGPGETTPVSMADALKAHIEQCPKHPMSALRAELAEAVTARDTYAEECRQWRQDQRRRPTTHIPGPTGTCPACSLDAARRASDALGPLPAAPARPEPGGMTCPLAIDPEPRP